MSVTGRLRGVVGRGGGGERDGSATVASSTATAAHPLGTRLLALGGVALLLGATLQVMYFFINVTGVPYDFLVLVAATMLAATVTARYVRPWLAVGMGVVLLGGGLIWYMSTIASNPPIGALVLDAISLVAGETLLRITNIHEWVLGVAPGPIFVTWYFAVRRWYSAAVVVAGATLGFFVLTTDATVITTVTGVVGGAAAVGFGDLERRGKSVLRGEVVVAVVAVMIIVPGIVSVVPASAGAALPFTDGFVGDGDGSLESSLTGVDQRVEIQGAIELSPKVAFSVTSTEEAYWRVASYDRYSGDGWVRTGGTDRYRGGFLQRPPGESTMITQRISMERELATIPAAWRPVQLEGLENVSVTDAGSLLPGESLESGESYIVRSAAPRPSPAALQNASTDYPDVIEERYTQLPADTPDRVADRTERLTANAETPYETALTIERWLEDNREYSLNVRKPRGNVADAFLFEMDRGYCTYYATTMVVMLRSEGIPARFVTGYTPGERVAGDRWVVRGEDSHAWVEVYFPDQGWVKFDPTPAGPREAAEQQRLEAARQGGESGVDTGETSDGEEWTPEPTPTPEPLTPIGGSNDTFDGTNSTSDGVTTPQGEFLTPGPNGRVPDFVRLNSTPRDIVTATDEANATGGDQAPLLPTRHQLGLGLLAFVGLVAGVRRTNAAERVYRAAWVRYQPRSGEPTEQIERAYQRLVYHLERGRYRSREPGETARQWFVAIDASEDAKQVLLTRERARYAGQATEEDADFAVETVDQIVR